MTFGIVALFADVRRGEVLGLTFPLPVMSSIDGFAVALALVAFVGLWRYRWNVLWVVGASALAGLAYGAVT